MELELVKKRVRDAPHLSHAEAEDMKSFIFENEINDILELGFCHGVSTCYFAAILDTQGKGHITTIDLESAKDEKPNIETLLNDLKLKNYVTIYYEPTTYLWRLMKMLEEKPVPRFDFCYIDGAHNWATDGFAFLLVDKLLKPGGWIAFDDLEWSYAASPSLKKTPEVMSMPEDERIVPQIRKVYELLVKPHPDYDNFFIKNGKAFAHKKSGAAASQDTVKKEIVYVKESMGLGAVIYKVAKKLIKRKSY
jgi:predicted O-methyltransferase YrrM